MGIREAAIQVLGKAGEPLQAKEIEDVVYDLKAVNPNKKPVVDMRTPDDLLAIIEEEGNEISEAMAALRQLL